MGRGAPDSEPSRPGRGRVLVCDDEAGLREMLSVLLRRAGYEATLTRDVAEAVRTIDERPPFDAVVTDLALPDGSGMEVLAAARAKEDATQVVMVTAFGTTEQAVAAMQRGAYHYVQKPFRNHELLAVLEKALEKRHIVHENRALRAQVGYGRRSGLIGRSAAMQRVLDLVKRAAGSRSSVLITGESGTGKEVVARALHDQSDRRDEPFVVVNCGALPESLMESELFGHEKGAFTGAGGAHLGLFRSANGGTLLLDEVGELPLSLQVKLLRVLQERRVRPVGGASETEVDIRLVAATNRSLEEAVREGAFRQDLFYRLNVIRIRLPPLRERREDVPLLADHFLSLHAARAGRQLFFAESARRWLLAQPFRGNVRELENVVERAVALATSAAIDVPDLVESGTVPPPAGEVDLSGHIDLDAYLASVEQRLILEALRRCDGVRTEAAKRLGVSFRSLRYRLAKYGLAEDDDPA